MAPGQNVSVTPMCVLSEKNKIEGATRFRCVEPHDFSVWSHAGFLRGMDARDALPC